MTGVLEISPDDLLPQTFAELLHRAAERGRADLLISCMLLKQGSR